EQQYPGGRALPGEPGAVLRLPPAPMAAGQDGRSPAAAGAGPGAAGESRRSRPDPPAQHVEPTVAPVSTAGPGGRGGSAATAGGGALGAAGYPRSGWWTWTSSCPGTADRAGKAVPAAGASGGS